MNVPEVSLVVPCHNEEDNIAALTAAIRDVLEGRERYELILVDDGSLDDTWAAITAAAGGDARVRGLRLTRGFGQQAAVLAGLRAARGNAVISMDADLQHPPSVLPELLALWRAGARVVHTQRIDAQGTGPLKRTTSRWFYALFSRLTGVKVSPGSSDFRLLDRYVVDTILVTEEGEYFLRGLVNWMGYRSATVRFRAAPRHAGTPSYSPRRMMRFAVSAIVSFSVVPLRIGVGLGLITAALAFAYLAFVVISAFVGRTTPGWASAVGVTTLLFGIQFILIGLLGEYLGRVHLAVKHRPPFLVAESTDLQEQERLRTDRPEPLTEAASRSSSRHSPRGTESMPAKGVRGT